MFLQHVHQPEHARVWLISDLHLWHDRPLTTQKFLSCLDQAVQQTDALFILGDLFEYWAGDDDIDAPGLAPIVHALSETTRTGLPIYFLPGNRDFLLGQHAAHAMNLRLLADECVLEIGREKYLLMHGDTLCTDDLAYQQFRKQVRDPGWQAVFLAKPLIERHALIAQMRTQSDEQKSRLPSSIMDVNSNAVEQALGRHSVNTLIHGHTHRPAIHQLKAGQMRYVLADWEFDELPHRGGAALVLP